MGLLSFFKNKAIPVTKYEMIVDKGSGFYSYNGNLYQSDIVRAAIRPKVQSVGKLVAKHIRDSAGALSINPDVYMKFLLEEPNPYMTGQMLQEKLTTQLELNNNAFAYIRRDDNGYPIEIYPINAATSEALQNDQGEVFIKFTLLNARTVTFRYSDIIHLRKDFNRDDIFGDSPAAALTSLMEIVTTTDQGIVKAIKNSNVIKWLLKFNQTLRPEDVKKNTQEFITNYLNVESETVGAAAVDAKMDAQQVDPKDYVPNALQMDKTVQRIYSFFNTNEAIVQNKYNENDWISYYEGAVENIAIQLSNEYTRKLFTRRERGFGNRIIFESSNLTYASMQTKLSLVQYIDRGVLSPNELRAILSLAPIPEGDVYIRRLDTAPINTKAQ